MDTPRFTVPLDWRRSITASTIRAKCVIEYIVKEQQKIPTPKANYILRTLEEKLTKILEMMD